MTLIFKISPEAEWAAACVEGVYRGSADDARDGFIHFSAAHQLKGTLAKYYAGKQNVLLIAFDDAALGPGLKWEPSRGGDLFPHLYGDLDPTHAIWTAALDLGADGIPVVPAEASSC